MTTVVEPPVILPKLHWDPTAACGQRHGAKIKIVPVHRWGVTFAGYPAERLSYQGVIREFKNPANEASAHFVYPGSAVPNDCTQMVSKADFAWTEAAYNPVAVEVESADAIWVGGDTEGMEQLARIIAFLLHENHLPPVWSTHEGFCRHGDLGQPGGGHLQCPTTDMKLWKKFAGLVQKEAVRGDFLAHWGR